jgi:hypothetical protein
MAIRASGVMCLRVAASAPLIIGVEPCASIFKTERLIFDRCREAAIGQTCEA